MPFFITFSIAIVALYLSLNVADEIMQLAVALPALLCLFFSIAFAPLPVQLLIGVTLLFSNKHTQDLPRCNLFSSPKGSCDDCLVVDHNDCFLRYK